MASNKRTGSAVSSSSNELLDKQLNELICDAETPSRHKKTQAETYKESIGEDDAGDGENVAVMVRCRPLSVGGNAATGKIKNEREQPVVKVDEINKCVQLSDRQFFFDQVFGTECDNDQLYMRSARRLVDCAFKGYNCTIFLYGQTGTGKTYTHSSLTLSAFEHLFSLIQDSSKGMRFLIKASYYELYNEEIRDLLARNKSSGAKNAQKPLELRESKERGVYVKDLTCFLVNNLVELRKLKQLGDRRRTTASTRMNEHSSRSHSIFSITIETVSTDTKGIEQAARKSASKSNKLNATREPSIRVGHLNLIDLAGSERQSKSGASGVALKEASRINLSLTCLSLVIRALTDKTGGQAGGHIPYRNSKLTRLLSSSLGGNSKTILIACISAAKSNFEETLNTLRFASRTKLIKNRAVINEDPKDALLRKYRKQLEELRMKINERQQMTNAANNSCPERKTSKEASLSGLDQEELEQEESEQLRLNKQLELLKAKIMFGGENLLDKVELHERLLEASRAELEDRRRQEAELRERLQNKEKTIERVFKSKDSLESQLENLDVKLNKSIELYKSSKLELRDLASEHEQLKEQLLQTIKSTSKEIKYVDCIVEDFVPREYLDLINAYAQYDEESDEWQIKYIALSGNNIAQTKRLVGSASTLLEPSERVAASGPIRGDRKLSAGRTPKQRLKSLDSASNRPDPFMRLQ